MPATGTKTGKNRDENINLRASRSQKTLIDRAADALGGTGRISCSRRRAGKQKQFCSTVGISLYPARNSSALRRC